MSKQNKKIEDTFNEFLAGDELKNALDFAEFLKANEMIYNGNYEMHYKDKCACYIDIDISNELHMWKVWTVGDYSNEYEGFQIDDFTKEIAWLNVAKCGNCDGVDCNPGKTEVIFGKEFTNVCNGTDNLSILFINPDAEVLECAKKMVEMTRYVIDNHTE